MATAATLSPNSFIVLASLSSSHCSSLRYMPPPKPMIEDDTDPEMPIKQLSWPPPMYAGAMALGGGDAGVLPGALPLYVVLELFELEELVMLLPCWFVLRLSTVALFCAMAAIGKSNRAGHFIWANAPVMTKPHRPCQPS